MSNVIVKDMGMKKILNEMKHDKSYVQIGFYDSEEHKNAGGQTVASVAARNEYGDPDNKFMGRSAPVPARPFMRQSFEKNVDNLKVMQGKVVDLIYKGRMTIETGLSKLGTQHEGDIKKEIGSGDFVPNTPFTIKMKTRNGKRGDKPLIDSGQMIQSVAHKVQMKG